jgi:hypothetical protein
VRIGTYNLSRPVHSDERRRYDTLIEVIRNLDVQCLAALVRGVAASRVVCLGESP